MKSWLCVYYWTGTRHVVLFIWKYGHNWRPHGSLNTNSVIIYVSSIVGVDVFCTVYIDILYIVSVTEDNLLFPQILMWSHVASTSESGGANRDDVIRAPNPLVDALLLLWLLPMERRRLSYAMRIVSAIIFMKFSYYNNRPFRVVFDKFVNIIAFSSIPRFLNGVVYLC